MGIRTWGLVALLAATACVPKSKFDKVQHQLEACRGRAGGGGGGGGGGGDSARGALLREQLKPLIDEGILEVEEADGRWIVGMKSEILFASGSAELSEKGAATIARVARILQRQTDADWQVEGHTDNTGASAMNWALGANRALAVLNVMITNGMDPNRLSAATFGEFEPMATNDTDTGRALNRRIEIVWLPTARAKRLR